jgi:hypothetical protein
MSEERRKRKEEREQAGQPKPMSPRTIKILLIVAAFVVVACLALWSRQRTAHKYDNFAKCLTAKQAKMYGLYWCVHCADQKELFSTAFQYVTYVECGIKGSSTEEASCAAKNIKNFPTWEFADGDRRTGVQSMDFLSEKTGCTLP